MIDIFDKDAVVYKDNKEYRKLVYEAYEKYPNDDLSQINYVKENGNQQNYLVFLCETLQRWAGNGHSRADLFEEKSISFKLAELEGLFGALTFAFERLQPNMKEHEVNYVINRSNDFVSKVVNELKEYEVHNK